MPVEVVVVDVMNIFLFAICLLVSGCGCSYAPSAEGPKAQAFFIQASNLEDRLRSHFSGQKTYEISGLIAETRTASNAFKRMGYPAIANKFDSYTDVLMYGNRTLAESMNDVISLVRGRKATTVLLMKPVEEPSFFNF